MLALAPPQASWSRALHRWHPQPCRAAVRLLLLTARHGHRRAPAAGQPYVFSWAPPPAFDFQRLPLVALGKILRFAARPLMDWMQLLEVQEHLLEPYSWPVPPPAAAAPAPAVPEPPTSSPEPPTSPVAEQPAPPAAAPALAAALPSTLAAPVPATLPMAGQPAAAASAASGHRVCAAPGCGATRGLKRCGGCGTARYCSEACSRAHWREHRNECRRLQAEKAAAAASATQPEP